MAEPHPPPTFCGGVPDVLGHKPKRNDGELKISSPSFSLVLRPSDKPNFVADFRGVHEKPAATISL